MRFVKFWGTVQIDCPKGFLEASDAHVEPIQSMPSAWHFMCARARELHIPVVAAGDIFDLIIWGWQRYWGSHATCDFMRSLDGLECYFVVGNHEGKAKWVRRLFHACPNIHVVTELTINVDVRPRDPIRYVGMSRRGPLSRGVKWHIEHGDRFALDWGPLGGLYRSVAYAFLSVAPRLWFRMMTRWRPGKMKPPLGTESEKYTKLTGYIWRKALRDAVRRRANKIIGHTHTTERRKQGHYELFDGGDVRDGSTGYVDPSGNVSVKWFGGLK